jgi:hypothetical protein
MSCRGCLAWHEIDVTTVNLDAIILGEFHVNAMRKDVTVSESLVDLLQGACRCSIWDCLTKCSTA